MAEGAVGVSDVVVVGAAVVVGVGGTFVVGAFVELKESIQQL